MKTITDVCLIEILTAKEIYQLTNPTPLVQHPMVPTLRLGSLTIDQITELYFIVFSDRNPAPQGQMAEITLQELFARAKMLFAKHGYFPEHSRLPDGQATLNLKPSTPHD